MLTENLIKGNLEMSFLTYRIKNLVKLTHSMYIFKGTVMQIEKGLINDRLHVPKVY